MPLAALFSSGVAARQSPAVVTPTFSAQDFFLGRTEGDGELKVIMSRRRAVHVDGTGRMSSNELVLDQVVAEEGKTLTKREWRIREVSPGHYLGSLTDADSAVVGDVAGTRLRLRFRMKGGLRAKQVLDLSPDGNSARNHMTIRKFGMVVATLDETIRKVGA